MKLKYIDVLMVYFGSLNMSLFIQINNLLMSSVNHYWSISFSSRLFYCVMLDAGELFDELCQPVLQEQTSVSATSCWSEQWTQSTSWYQPPTTTTTSQLYTNRWDFLKILYWWWLCIWQKGSFHKIQLKLFYCCF